MVLPLAKVAPRATQSQFSNTLSTQRELDDEMAGPAPGQQAEPAGSDYIGPALMHYRARTYDPRLGRFLQKDPLLELRVKMSFSYASNSPTMRVDPSGTQDIVAPVPTGGSELERYKLTKGLTTEQKETVKAALSHAAGLTMAAKKVLEKVKSDPANKGTAEYKVVELWFGEVTTKEEVDLLISRFSKAEAILLNQHAKITLARMGSTQPVPDLVQYGRYRYNAATSGSGRANTPGGSAQEAAQVGNAAKEPWWTELHPDFFDDTKHALEKDFWSREGILLHEATHAAWDSLDKAKSSSDPLSVRLETAKDFAKEAATRSTARANASNYQFFAEDVRKQKLGK